MPFDPSQAGQGTAGDHPLRVYKTSFRAPAHIVPTLVDFSSLGKGQVYLNGTPLGRYWAIGPQLGLYIPESWMREENELVIFEEEGRTPEGVAITDTRTRIR
jgi:hypothetical protein